MKYRKQRPATEPTLHQSIVFILKEMYKKKNSFIVKSTNLLTQIDELLIIGLMIDTSSRGSKTIKKAKYIFKCKIKIYKVQIFY